MTRDPYHDRQNLQGVIMVKAVCAKRSGCGITDTGRDNYQGSERARTCTAWPQGPQDSHLPFAEITTTASFKPEG